MKGALAALPALVTLVLGAVILFLGGLVVGRATMTGSPDAAPTSRAVGPRRYLDGVGVGYARSQEGAVAAAANFTRVLSSDLILDDARRRAAIDVLAAPEARSRLQKSFDQAVTSLRQGLGVTGAAGQDAQVLLRATPVGWRVEAYDAGKARVAIWVTSVGGSIGGTNQTAPIARPRSRHPVRRR